MKTITLCGSARFEREYKTCLKLLTMQGVVAIGLGSYPSENDGDKDWYGQTHKEIFDLVHLGKVQQADAVLVINCQIGDEPFDRHDGEIGYIGFSTAREILWASLNGIPVAFLSDLLAGHTSIQEAMADLPGYVSGIDIQPMELSVAQSLLDRALARQSLDQAQVDTKRDTMHAALSRIAANRHPEHAIDSPEVAAEVLEFLGLVVLPPEQRDAYLRPVGLLLA